MNEHDDLDDRLRAADPAADLPPADPARVDRLLEAAMTDPETARSNPLRWLVAAAALLLIAGAGTLMVLGRPDAPTPPATVADPGSPPTSTELTVAGDGAGRCMVPNPEVLAGAAYAVDAEVTAVAGGRATLAPTTWYAGKETDTVEVAAGSADLAALIGAPQFEEGQRYLVAANEDGRVMVCGFSGLWSDDLASLYAEAFGA